MNLVKVFNEFGFKQDSTSELYRKLSAYGNVECFVKLDSDDSSVVTTWHVVTQYNKYVVGYIVTITKIEEGSMSSCKNTLSFKVTTEEVLQTILNSLV